MASGPGVQLCFVPVELEVSGGLKVRSIFLKSLNEVVAKAVVVNKMQEKVCQVGSLRRELLRKGEESEEPLKDNND